MQFSGAFPSSERAFSVLGYHFFSSTSSALVLYSINSLVRVIGVTTKWKQVFPLLYQPYRYYFSYGAMKTEIVYKFVHSKSREVAGKNSQYMLGTLPICVRQLKYTESKNDIHSHYLYQLWRHSEKAMAPHSSTLAWKISWTEEPGRLQSMGSLRVRHD